MNRTKCPHNKKLSISLSKEEAVLILHFIESSSELMDGITDPETEIVINLFYNRLKKYADDKGWTDY